MKTAKLIITTLFISFCHVLFGQYWVTLNSIPFVGSEVKIVDIDESNCLFSGYNGGIYMTENGGDSFTKTFSTHYYVRAIDMINDNLGYAVIGYDYYKVIKTSDGGKTWNPLCTIGGIEYYDLNFIDDTHGWAVGSYNSVARTTNGGQTWQLISGSIYSDNWFQASDFINADTGILCGNIGLIGEPLIQKTYDGGLTRINLQAPSISHQLVDVEMISANEIWLAEGMQAQGNNKLYHSTDGGATWQNVQVSSDYDHAIKLYFADALQGRLISTKCIYITNDGGVTWISRPISNLSTFRLTGGSWADLNTAYVIDDDGVIFKTTDAGLSWEIKSNGFRSNLMAIEFNDEFNGCVAGQYDTVTQEHYNVIYCTSDGGYHWKGAVMDTIENGMINDVDYQNENTIWACGNKDLVYRSNDAGDNWQRFSPTGNQNMTYNAIEVLDNGIIYVGGNKLYFSYDNGSNWYTNSLYVPGYVVTKIEFTDALNGYVSLAGNTYYGKLFKTTDGGNTWIKMPDFGNDSSTIMAFSFANKNDGLVFARDKGLFKTNDGGLSWLKCNLSNDAPPQYLKMFDSNKAVLCSYNNIVFYSMDGGVTWTEATDSPVHNPNPDSNDLQETATSSLGGQYFFLNMGKGWYCGSYGLIEAYYNPFVKNKIPEKSGEYTFSVLPNPATEQIQISGNERIERIEVLNANGQLVRILFSQQTKIDIKSFPAGMYYVIIYSDNIREVHKIIKE